MPDFAVDASKWDRVMDGLVRGAYSLTLGAGASFGAQNGNGLQLPIAAHLGRELLSKYEIPAPPESIGLRSVYDLADRVARRDAKELPRVFLSRMFQNCTVPDWYRQVVSIPWEIIWNLNIDDVLERAYTQVFKDAALQEYRAISWNESVGFHREPGSSVSAVALHGRAVDGDIVFGSLEYLAVVNRGGPAHQLFWDTWASTPAIIVGASLTDEIDMAAPLSEIRPSIDEDIPSVVVMKTVSEYDRFRLESAGLLPVEATAEAFFATIAEDWTRALGRLSSDDVMSDSTINPASAYFMRHFRQLSSKEDRHHDFIAGDEPLYSDILAGRDALRVLPDLPRLSGPDDVAKAFPAGTSTTIVFTGVLSGATTAELRFLRELEQAGMRIFEFDGDATFDARAVHWAFKRDATLVARIQDLADFPAALAKLAELAAKSETTTRLVSSASKRDTRQILLSGGGSISTVAVPDTLRDSEIDSLIARLEEHNRLNVIKNLKPSERIHFFRELHRRSLFDGLAAATQGRSFLARAEDEFADAARGQHASVAHYVLVSSEIGYPLPEGLVARLVGLSAGELASIVEEDGPLSRICYRRRGHLVPRHRTLAARVSEKVMTEDERWVVSLKLGVGLAPYVNRDAISRRTRMTRLVSQLMDADRIINWFGQARTDDWYQNLYDEYSWNSRYWEQRALAEIRADVPRFERAEAWAREAVARHSDAFSLNTLGTILLRRATSSADFDTERFFAGMKEVEAAERRLDRPSEHPYVTAFSYLRHALRATQSNKHVHPRIRNELNEWVQLAHESTIWQDKISRQRLNTLISRAYKATLT
jgi:hypothetical protein